MAYMYSRRWTIRERPFYRNQEEVERQAQALSFHNIAHLKLSLGGWTLVDSFILEFITSSNQLQRLDLDWVGTRGTPIDTDFLQACLEGAKNNSSIAEVKVSGKVDETGLSPGVMEALRVVDEKVMEIFLKFVTHLNVDHMEVLCSTIASLGKLENLCLWELYSDDLFLELMLALSRKEIPKLKKLFLFQTSPTLPGIDVFLSSSGASILEELEVTMHDTQFLGVSRLVTGLSNCCIKKLRLSPQQINPEASQIVAEYINQTPPSLVSLQISDLVDIILPSLYGNKTIQKLCLHWFEHSNEESVKNLLLQNSNIKELRCESGANQIDKLNAWLHSTADGLSQNATLHSFQVTIAPSIETNWSLDLGPIFQALLAPAVALQKLLIVGVGLRQKPAVMAQVLQSPQCKLRELELCLYWKDAAILAILSAMQKNITLKKLKLRSCGALEWDTWSAIASIVPKLNLKHVLIEQWEAEVDLNIMEDIQRKLLKGVAQNETLERAKFQFDQPSHLSQSFRVDLEKYCIRNMAIKACNGLKKDVCGGGLPLATLPPVLKALWGRSKSTEQKEQLWNTVVFCLLNSGRLSPQAWKSVKAACRE